MAKNPTPIPKTWGVRSSKVPGGAMKYRQHHDEVDADAKLIHMAIKHHIRTNDTYLNYGNYGPFLHISAQDILPPHLKKKYSLFHGIKIHSGGGKGQAAVENFHGLKTLHIFGVDSLDSSDAAKKEVQRHLNDVFPDLAHEVQHLHDFTTGKYSADDPTYPLIGPGASKDVWVKYFNHPIEHSGYRRTVLASVEQALRRGSISSDPAEILRISKIPRGQEGYMDRIGMAALWNYGKKPVHDMIKDTVTQAVIRHQRAKKIDESKYPETHLEGVEMTPAEIQAVQAEIAHREAVAKTIIQSALEQRPADVAVVFKEEIVRRLNAMVEEDKIAVKTNLLEPAAPSLEEAVSQLTEEEFVALMEDPELSEEDKDQILGAVEAVFGLKQLDENDDEEDEDDEKEGKKKGKMDESYGQPKMSDAEHRAAVDGAHESLKGALRSLHNLGPEASAESVTAAHREVQDAYQDYQEKAHKAIKQCPAAGLDLDDLYGKTASQAAAYLKASKGR